VRRTAHKRYKYFFTSFAVQCASKFYRDYLLTLSLCRLRKILFTAGIEEDSEFPRRWQKRKKLRSDSNFRRATFASL